MKKILVLAAFVCASLFQQSFVYANTLSDKVLKQALEDARNDDFLLVNSMKSSLKSHELWPYYEYHDLRSKISAVSPTIIQQYLLKNADNPLADWMHSAAINAYGEKENWKSVLFLQKTAPKAVKEQCYYYRALQKFKPQQAEEGAKALWLSAESRPSECDALFDWAKSNDIITDQEVWDRAMLALEAGNGGLAKYLSKSLSDTWAIPQKALKALLADPKQIIPAQKILQQANMDQRKFGYYSTLYLAKKDVATALRLLPLLSKTHQFNLTQQTTVNRAVVQQGNKSSDPYIARQLIPLVQQLGEQKLISPTLRKAIQDSDWDKVLFWLSKVKDQSADDSYMNYWKARAFEAKGYRAQAMLAYETAAKARNFFGFMAAEKLGQPYSLNMNPVTLTSAENYRISSLPAIKRVKALIAIDEQGLALSELKKLIENNYVDPSNLAQYCLEQGWPNLAISVTISAKLWNNLEQRFPVGFESLFKHWSDKRDVDPYLLMSIARRESALNPDAQSGAGARGLMQVMPATGKQIAKEIGMTEYRGSEMLFDPAVSVRMGSYYVSSLLEKYGDNRIAMLSGYNAGPHRIEKWLQRVKPIAVDQFIESIPFYETRAYVKAVLTYRVIFEALTLADPRDIDEIELLTDKERTFSYNKLPN